MSFGHGGADDTRKAMPMPIIDSPTSEGGGPPGRRTFEIQRLSQAKACGSGLLLKVVTQGCYRDRIQARRAVVCC